MKIGIDIDDTLTDTIELQHEYWKEYYLNNPQEGYTEEVPNNINVFGYKYIEDYWDLYRDKLFYPRFKKDASLITNKLKNEGHTLCVITSRPDHKYEKLHQRLEEWFKENNIPIDIIYTNIRNKGHYCKQRGIDMLIDNDLSQIEEGNKYHIPTILFGTNNEYKGQKAANWQEVYEIIKNTTHQ